MDVKCKILQLGKFFPITGGVEKVEYTLLTGVSCRGFQCDMLCAAQEGEGQTIVINPNAKLITTRTWKKISATMIAPSMVTELRRICNDYDIIHLHHPDPMACMALFFSGFKGKVILHWHSDIVKQRFLLKLYKPFQDWLIKRADVIIGTSSVYLEESPHLKGAKDKMVTIPIGVDQVDFNAHEVDKIKKKYAGRKIIFALGRLVEYKGFEYLIRAAKHFDDQYVFIIGGKGPLEQELRDLIKAEGVEQRVELIGFVGDEELAGYYGACDVFCLPSIYKTEAFGLVQVEAMSCGKPVVATRIPGSGVSWVNKHGDSGLNVETCNPEELAAAIKHLVTNQTIYLQFSKQARERYLNTFTTERMIDHCVCTYEEVLCGQALI